MFYRTVSLLLLFLLFLPIFLLFFIPTTHAFIGEETKESILSLIQGFLMMFLLHFFTRDSTGEGEIYQENHREMPEGVHFIDTTLSPREESFFLKANEARQEEGLSPLVLDGDLISLAREKAEDLAREDYFHHQSPSLGSPFDMMLREGISYLYAGENIGKGMTVKRVHRGLMNSESHRENILEDRFTHIGVGIVDGPQGTMYVQLFIEREG